MMFYHDTQLCSSQSVCALTAAAHLPSTRPGNKIGDDGRRPCHVLEDAYSRLAWIDMLDAHMDAVKRRPELDN